MISIKSSSSFEFHTPRKSAYFILELVPSSARSSTSAASPLPPQFVPLLGDALEQVKRVIDKVLPVSKKRTALEEALYEDEDEEGALDREMMMQCERARP